MDKSNSNLNSNVEVNVNMTNEMSIATYLKPFTNIDNWLNTFKGPCAVSSIGLGAIVSIYIYIYILLMFYICIKYVFNETNILYNNILYIHTYIYI